MNDSRSTPEHPQHSEMRRNFGLRTRMVRYRALRSAWAVLAPSGLSTEKQRIADTGRSLNDELTMLVAQHPDVDQHALEKLDPQLDSFEREMRSIAQLVPLAQLRSTLPERVADDRRGVLDLLDLLLGAEIEGLEGT